MKLFIVFSVPSHCGHEVISRIFTEEQKAIDYCHEQNLEWAKWMSSWDGTQTLFQITIKDTDNPEDFDFECDQCGYSYRCECFPQLVYKTEENYEKYWSEERKDHNQNHSHSNPLDSCKFCQEDKTLWWIPALHNLRSVKG